MNKLLGQVLENIDALLIIGVSTAAAIFGVFGGSQEIVLSAIAGTIALIAYSIFRDREARRDLVKQVQEINHSLTIIRDRTSADDFFHSGSSESQIIGQAELSLWLVQETGAKLIEDNLKSLEQLLKNGGTLRIILAMPDDDVLGFVSFRNRNLQRSDIKVRHENVVRQLTGLSLNTGMNTDSLEVRLIHYPIDTTYVLVDAESPKYNNRLGLVRLAGFLDYFADKRDFSLSYRREPSMYQYFSNQFTKMWEVSIKLKLDTRE